MPLHIQTCKHFYKQKFLYIYIALGIMYGTNTITYVFILTHICLNIVQLTYSFSYVLNVYILDLIHINSFKHILSYMRIFQPIYAIQCTHTYAHFHIQILYVYVYYFSDQILLFSVYLHIFHVPTHKQMHIYSLNKNV